MNDFTVLEFPEAQQVMVCGDIHGEFNTLVNKLCVQYQTQDTLLIVAGDCGFGFCKPAYYEEMAKKHSKSMADANNWIVFVRGTTIIQPILTVRRSTRNGSKRYRIIR